MKISTFLALLLLLCAPLHAQTNAKPEPPTVNLGVGRDVAPGSKIQLSINTRNQPAVNIAAWRLDDFSWLLNRDRDGRSRPKTAGKPDLFFRSSVVDPKEKQNQYQIDVYRSRQINLPLTRPGVYLVEASGGGASDWGVVNVTNLAVVAKRSPRHLLSWVTDFRGGQIVSGANVELWNRDGKAVKGARGATAGDGAIRLATGGGSDQVLVVTKGDDAAGVVVSNSEPDGQLKMHFQSDRPIYRPGQTVFWKAILRRTQSNGWAPVAGAQCAVQVRDSKDIVLFQETIQTNARGTLNGQVLLPQEGSLGQYSITITPPGGETQYGTFTVAAYRKPEYQVEIAPLQKRYLAGETVKFKLDATYFFGAPVPNATVRYTIRRAPLALQFPGDDDDTDYFYGGDGNLYDSDSYNQNDVVADASADLDAQGQVTISVETPQGAGDATYSLAATVTDGSRRQVEGSASAPVYSAAKRVAVAGEVSYVPVGYLMPLQIRVADLDGKPAAGVVNLELQKAVWNAKESRTRYQKITATTVRVPASGIAKATLPAQTQGNLRVRATLPDGGGRTAIATWDFWVSGPQTSWENTDAPTLTVKPDKRAYKPGETMKILVSTNVKNRPVLATIEGLDVWNYRVIGAGNASFIWQVPARLELSPNAYAAATQWTPNGLIGDTKILPVPDPSRRLEVEIKSDKSVYRPGETARYTLTTRDENGQGVPAEVAVGVIDSALLSIRPDNTPDLYGMFWANRENYVSTASSAPQEVSGGAYQRVGKTASIRSVFKDTAYWNARVETDKSGSAKFEVMVPGNLTTWKATARAITADTRVGTGQSSALATRPVTLRLATPRQLVQGDFIDLIASANNRTDAALTLETALSATGLLVEGAKVKILPAPAKGEAKTTFPLRANALPESGAAVLTGRTLASSATKANAADLSDALESRIPVVPDGIARRIVQGGALENRVAAQIELPADRIEPATSATLTIARGFGEVAQGLGANILSGQRESAPDAAARLVAVALLKPNGWQREAIENIAMLARYQTGQGGWNWWEDQRPDPRVTAFVLSSLDRAAALGVNVPDALKQRGIGGAVQLYNSNNLWEERALLASALALSGNNDKDRLAEVNRRAENLSPFARLTLAEAFFSTGQKASATQILNDVLKDANIGTDEASIAVGARDGWENSSADATSAALSLLLQLQTNRALQAKFARYLSNQANLGYQGRDAQTHRLRALWKYDDAHPGAREIGALTVTLNGQSVKVPAAVSYKPLEIVLPRNWKDGANSLRIERDGAGEVFWNVEARVYQPASVEVGKNVRVFRRYETQNAALTWRELDGPVKVGSAVRCTVVVWPDDRADALKVVEPIPAGFEYVDSDGDYGQSGDTEVRDGAVVHYLHGNGLPVTFRYYLRSETTGRVTALPALAEVVQRPDARGNSDVMRFVVTE